MRESFTVARLIEELKKIKDKTQIVHVGMHLQGTNPSAVPISVLHMMPTKEPGKRNLQRKLTLDFMTNYDCDCPTCTEDIAERLSELDRENVERRRLEEVAEKSRQEKLQKEAEEYRIILGKLTEEEFKILDREAGKRRSNR